MAKIHESIVNIMADCEAITKNKKNKQQDFMYRGIDDIMNVFNPLFTKHKVFVVPVVIDNTRENRLSKDSKTLLYSICKIKYTFYADDGSSIEAVVVGEGMDTADKASNKAMAVAMKYAILQVFCTPTEDLLDPDSETNPPSTRLAAMDLETALKYKTSKGQAFSELTVEQLNTVLEKGTCEQKIAAKVILESTEVQDGQM